MSGRCRSIPAARNPLVGRTAARYRAEGYWTRNDTRRRRPQRVSETRLGPAHRGRSPGHASRELGPGLRLAGFFLSRGLKPGDVVSFQLPNWIETAVIALAARMSGW